MVPCTLLLFTAYAIVRTEPSATSAKPEEKKIIEYLVVELDMGRCLQQT